MGEFGVSVEIELKMYWQGCKKFVVCYNSFQTFIIISLRLRLISVPCYELLISIYISPMLRPISVVYFNLYRYRFVRLRFSSTRAADIRANGLMLVCGPVGSRALTYFSWLASWCSIIPWTDSSGSYRILHTLPCSSCCSSAVDCRLPGRPVRWFLLWDCWRRLLGVWGLS